MSPSLAKALTLHNLEVATEEILRDLSITGRDLSLNNISILAECRYGADLDGNIRFRL